MTDKKTLKDWEAVVAKQTKGEGVSSLLSLLCLGLGL